MKKGKDLYRKKRRDDRIYYMNVIRNVQIWLTDPTIDRDPEYEEKHRQMIQIAQRRLNKLLR